jgi:RNA polymerase sigma factor (sigma-70 family)
VTPELAIAIDEAVRAQRGYLVHHLGAGDAPDAVQETWLRLAEAYTAGKPIRKLGAYARGIARNLVRREIHRRQARRAGGSVHAGLPDPSPNPEHLLLERERRARGERILRGLPARMRELLLRIHIHGESAASVAVEFGRSSAHAVSCLAHRARRQARQAA